MRIPPRGEVWVHVDRLDRIDGFVWAVQYRGPKGARFYECVTKIEFHGLAFMVTKFFGRRSTVQPRLVLMIPGAKVTIFRTAPNVRVAKIVSPPHIAVEDRRRGRV
jgi:hypothetical protein